MPVLCLSRFLPGVAGPFKISVVSISELFGNLIIAPMKRRSERETERQRVRGKGRGSNWYNLITRSASVIIIFAEN
jgi:hypothetical protein